MKILERIAQRIGLEALDLTVGTIACVAAIFLNIAIFTGWPALADLYVAPVVVAFVIYDFYFRKKISSCVEVASDATSNKLEPSVEEILAAVRLAQDEAGVQTKPPAIAEWLVTLFVSKRTEALLGDLEERFHRHVGTRGLRRARALYWAEVLRSIAPMLIVKAKKLGVVALLAELWRRTSS